MTRLRWIRLTAIIAIIGAAVLVAGYRLSRPEPEVAVAGSAPVDVAYVARTRLVAAQATTIEEVQVRGVSAPTEQMVLFTNETFDYHLDYPLGWEVIEASAKATLFQAPTGESKVEVEVVGALPPDGLASFVDRSLGDDMIISRQLLTVHGQPAERIVAYSPQIGAQKTSFYIEGQASAFVITGVGEQKPIERMARSFNAPQSVAQR